MRTRRSGRQLVLVATAMLLVAQWSAPALAGPGEDKARNDADLARTEAALESATERAQQAVRAYHAATSALPDARTAAANARGRVIAAQVAAQQAQREAARYAEQYQVAAQQFDAANARLDAARRSVGEFVASTYRGADITAITSLLNAATPTDVARRLSYLQQLARGKQRAVVGFTAARLAAKDEQNRAALARQQSDEAAAEAERGLAAARVAQTEADRSLQRVNELAAQSAQAKAAADAERGAVLARYDQLRREGARIEAEIREAAARERRRGSRSGRSGRSGRSSRGSVAPGRSSAGYLQMPVEGWKSSDFGMRYDPYYRVWQLHAGMDLAAGSGQPVRAAAAGRVLRAGWNGGYGNYTCLYHGDYRGEALTTCYAHQAQILVGTGEEVRAGQTIGRVGTTGASTGYHLHFEVRLEGRPVDPARWLPSCLC